MSNYTQATKIKTHKKKKKTSENKTTVQWGGQPLALSSDFFKIFKVQS